jgi:putative MATE family efflux protein
MYKASAMSERAHEVDVLAPAVLVPETIARPAPDRARTDRDILRLTWPVVVAQSIVTVVQLFDILMLGQLGTETLAAVGYATQFLFLAHACLMAIGAAGVAMIARALGAGDQERARRALGTTMVIALATGSVLSTVALAIPRELLRLLDVPAPIVELAVPYFRLTLAAAFPLGIALAFEHGHQAARDTRRPMLIAIALSAVKLGLNALLIFGALGAPRLGVAGAGIATLASHWVAVALYVVSIRRHPEPCLRLGLADLRTSAARVREAIGIALPAIGERVLMTVAIMAYFRFLGQYGVAAIAAYNVGVRILSFTWIPGFGLSVAAATLVGQALGAGDAPLARQSGWRATWLGLVLSVGLGGLFIGLRVPFAEAFTNDPEVVRDLDSFILMLGLALPFLVAHFTLGGALRGAGDTVSPMWAAAVGNWVFRVPLGFAFAKLWGLAIVWVWSIMLIDHIARAVWLGLAFHFRSWDTRGVDRGSTIAAGQPP